MAGDRLARILALLSPPGEGEARSVRLCRVSADLAAVTGAGITLMSGDAPCGSVCTTDEVSAVVEELQFTLGEGPCIDAYRQDRPVLEPDLDHPVRARWLAFTPPAVDAGVRAVFGFPLQVGVVRLGALNLYRDRTGPLSDEQHADALVMAGVAARAVLLMQAHAPAGALGEELEEGGNWRFAVHQASGMVAAQLGVGIAEAMVRLRAHAFRADRLLADVADDVVSRRLRFDARSGDEAAGP